MKLKKKKIKQFKEVDPHIYTVFPSLRNLIEQLYVFIHHLKNHLFFRFVVFQQL